MKTTMLLTITLTTMLVLLNGCYWGFPPEHDRGDRHERRDREDRDDRYDRYDHHRDGDSSERR